MIVNCFVPWQGGFVMLQKPRRGWWYLPGGKVEDDELWRHAAIREFEEESGLQLDDATLCGVYRVHIDAGAESHAKERLIAQFIGHGPSGTLMSEHREGKLAVVRVDEMENIAMDEGDRLMVRHTLEAYKRNDPVVFFGRFTYDADHQVKSWVIDPEHYLTSRLEMDEESIVRGENGGNQA